MNETNESRMRKLNHIESIAGGNPSEFIINPADIEFLFDQNFDEFTKRVTSNVYCHKCENAYAKMTFDKYHLNIPERCVEYFGKCYECGEPLRACFAIVDRLDKVIELVEKKVKKK